ncbi:hypothetical protein, partial [Paenibacillus glycinis]|uniref:hypothetical protein n=1 Tax=Paenibacillus glycinis TaxID=2697035 RepID=UPI001F1B8758
KPIIPRRSFFDKGDFLALTGMFYFNEKEERLPRQLLQVSLNYCSHIVQSWLILILLLIINYSIKPFNDTFIIL